MYPHWNPTRRVLFIVVASLAACNDTHAPQLNRTPAFNAQAASAPFIAFGLSATEQHTCAVAPGSSVQCWGLNGSGQVGSGSSEAVVAAPARVGSALVTASAGGRHSCGLDTDGVAYCWGANQWGQLGTGNLTPSNVPQAVNTDVRFAQIGAGNGFTCALTHEGTTYCWGQNGQGQLGRNSTEFCPFIQCSSTPLAVNAPVFTDLQVGLWNGCGLTTEGDAHCWGNNTYGQLGVGVRGPARNAQVRAVTGGVRFEQISVGAIHMCGITATAAAYCWGDGSYGNLGNGSTAHLYTPTLVAGNTGFADISAGDGNVIFTHTCATGTDGVAYCWGANSSGQLGIAALPGRCTFGGQPGFTQPCASTPSRVETSVAFDNVEAGSQYTCGVSRQRRAFCWGSNLAARLGSDVAEKTSTPTPVATWAKGRPGHASTISAPGVRITSD